MNANRQLIENGRVVGERLAAVDPQQPTYSVWGEQLNVGGAPALRTRVASLGAVTPAGNLPAGDATYRGASVGFSRDGVLDGSYVAASEGKVDARNGFRQVAIGSRGSVLRDLNSGDQFVDTSCDFTESGQVNGSGFSMDVSSDFPGFDPSGTAQGNSYGPAAEEFGGVFQMSGTANSSYSGAFGGAR